MNKKLIILIFTITSFSKAAFAEKVMSPDQIIQYLASLTFLNEICESKYPHLKETIDASWIEGWDEPSKKWATNMKEGPDFMSALNKIRTEMSQNKDKIAEQCLPMYGPDSNIGKLTRDKKAWEEKRKDGAKN